MEKYPSSVAKLLTLSDLPVVAINQESIFTFINEMFVQEYGWSRKDLIGKPVMEIIPPHMRNAHMVGFSRFLATESSELFGKSLPLHVLYKDGRVGLSSHFILGEKRNNRWRFAAIIDFPDKNA